MQINTHLVENNFYCSLLFLYREGDPLLKTEDFTVLIKNSVQWPKFKESAYVLIYLKNLAVIYILSKVLILMVMVIICVSVIMQGQAKCSATLLQHMQ